jgi:hypothetical protein
LQDSRYLVTWSKPALLGVALHLLVQSLVHLRF